MLAIMTRDAKVIFSGHIGQDISLQLADIFAVDVVQADGQELVSLLNQFGSISQPPVSTRVVRWFGDEARFIAANITKA